MSSHICAWMPAVFAFSVTVQAARGEPDSIARDSAPPPAHAVTAQPEAQVVNNDSVIPRRNSDSGGTGIVRRGTPVRASDWLSWLITLPLCLILLAIAMRGRWRGAARGPRGAQAVTILSRTPLAGRQSLVMARFGQRVLLLGVSPDRVTLITQASDPLEVATLLGTSHAGTMASASNEFDRIVEEATESYSQAAGDMELAGNAPESEPPAHTARTDPPTAVPPRKNGARSRAARVARVDADRSAAAGEETNVADVTRLQMRELSEHMRQFASGTAA